ncbi:hypothetical protein GCM10007977_008160 [Dactylosporangium sucinum]|uniref:Uncharacterized protein n=1 Tax=Dactylosporangium sucinum TaxID=1424081 RepID=A0A917T4D8_9ACTN|nr:hypothetical protein GCM10007977_008160 [Dactylosporangium sucinum]
MDRPVGRPHKDHDRERPRAAESGRERPGADRERIRAIGVDQATPTGRNCTLTRGPTGRAVFGIACSHVR